MRRANRVNAQVTEVQRWFRRSVTCDGEPYAIDSEQAAAVLADEKNVIVVARAGSGKTRTIVAKMVYLIARCGVKPEEIMAFVFNANAAREINERLGRMRVDGVLVVGNNQAGKGEDGVGETKPGGVIVARNNRAKTESIEAKAGAGDGEGRAAEDVEEETKKRNTVKVARTFHAFARHIIYDVCDGKEKCGGILAGEKEGFVLTVVMGMMQEPKWAEKIWRFIEGGEMSEEEITEDINGTGRASTIRKMEEWDLMRFARMMVLFINRAQQKFLAGKDTLRESVRLRLGEKGVSVRERLFIELGTECYRRYHWCLLEGRGKVAGYSEFGTDFNLIVSWASKLILRGGESVLWLLGEKKYILIDEYQDFSQLFLSVVLAMREFVPEVRLFVVGDDWQAINRFAGSDVEYFKEFERFFPEDVKRLEISTNYRCDKEVVERARTFMKKGMGAGGEFRAKSHRAGKVVLVDPRAIPCTVAEAPGDSRGWRDAVYQEMARRMLGHEPKKGTVRYVKALVLVIRKNKKAETIMILHRNNETNLEGMSLEGLRRGLKWGLERLEIIDGVEFERRVHVMTMHKSKGLEAEVVIILEADEGVIPKVHPDTQLYGVFGETEEVVLDDQKRLFYVAMTRAKRRLYIIHNPNGGAGFIGYLGRGVERWEG